MIEGKTQEEIANLLADYIATVENPEYGGDREVINAANKVKAKMVFTNTRHFNH